MFIFFGLFDGFFDLGFYDFAGTGVKFAGALNDGVEVVVWGFRDGEGGGGEGGDLFTIDNHADDEIAIIEGEEVLFFKGWLKLFSEYRGIIGGDAEGDSSTNVAKYGIADSVGHLGGVLIGNGEIEAVFAGLGEDGGEGISGEVLELVYVEIKGAAIFYVGDVGTGHGGELDFGDEKAAEDAGVVFAN